MSSISVNMRSEGKKYFYFITLLRAFAAIIITNAHYTGIYPSDLIANGGLLGDVIFFSVSGFCLANPNMSFGKWYAKRLWRIYAVVWIATLAYVLLRAWEVNDAVDAVKWFIHPTKYHFIASISLLYIPLYFVAKHITLNKRHYTWLALVLLAVQLVLYFTIYNTTYYHIDSVREPFIEFLFFQTMILGLFYRRECTKQNLVRESQFGGKKLSWAFLLVLLAAYFASKMLFLKRASLSDFQILNQIILFITLFVLFRCTYTIESKLKNISNSKVWKVVEFLSDHTLEIYCVQYVLIDMVREWSLPFPLNWIVLTTLILTAATLLRWVSQYLINLVKI